MVSINPMINGFGVEFPHEERRRRRENLVVLTQPAVLRRELVDLGRLLAGGPRPAPAVDLGLHHPPAHRLLTDPQPAGHRLRGRRR
jgi:hypothetical protein